VAPSPAATSAEALRARNEGVYGGVAPVDARAARAEGGAGADDTFRAAMQRGAAKVKDGARYRASLARLHRAQVDVPEVGTISPKVLLPIVAAAIWAVNWALFMR